MLGVMAEWAATAVTAVAPLASLAPVEKVAVVTECALIEVDSEALVALADIACVWVPKVLLFAPFPSTNLSRKSGTLNVLLPFPAPKAVLTIIEPKFLVFKFTSTLSAKHARLVNVTFFTFLFYPFIWTIFNFYKKIMILRSDD